MLALAKHLPGARVRVITFDVPGAGPFDAGSGIDVQRVRRGANVPRVRMATLAARSVIEAVRFRADVVLVGHIAACAAGVAIRRLLGTPYVTYVHADEFHVWPRLARFAVRDSAAVIAVSRHSQAMSLASGGRPETTHRILNGVDLPSRRQKRAGSIGHPPTILTIARMVELYKGHDVMLRAMPLVLARVPEGRWIVIGDGPLRKAYEQTAEKLGIEAAVEFTGDLSDDERDDWLARATLFAMPSRLPAGGLGGEGFGIVYLEAAANGLPVIAADEGGAVDAVDAGRTGVLVDPRDHVGIADAIVALLQEPAQAHAMGEAGRAWAAELSWPSVAAKVADVLRSVASGPARP